ncbi:unnamed protein product [Cuscuta campestris]|uniref:Retropepsins domain-containing protein n=1 Tax=Cuscuta campestris TaxID=132261 RepID=A0A484LEC0_9ASTE|nr:unnamed protein product [Cuscuta campestris]
MTRRTEGLSPEASFDPEIESTCKRQNAQKNKAKRPGIVDMENQNNENNGNHGDGEDIVNNQNLTIRNLATPNLDHQPLCIQYPTLNAPLELRSGLQPVDRVMLDAASGGALIDKTPLDAWRLIDIMASNSHQFGTRQDVVVKKEHYTDNCPSLLQGRVAEANALRFPNSAQRRYDPYSNTYNPGWKNHPNMSYGNRNNQMFSSQPEPSQTLNSTMESMMQKLVDGQLKLEQEKLKFEQETRVGMQDLRTQVGQLATSISKLESQLSNKLPSQSRTPNESANAVILRSGKALGGSRTKEGEPKVDEERETEVKDDQIINKETPQLQKDASPMDEKVNSPLNSSLSPNVSLPFFPSRLAKQQKEDNDKDIWETFRKVEVNIPLIDAIKQVPRYAKFLKELCTNKRGLKGIESVSLSENDSAILQRKLPVKCKDKGSFSIPCSIGGKKFERALCDLGASINVMPYSVFVSLNIGTLNESSVVIKLADRSSVYPEGLVEDVLVQIENLIFPADFYVLKMEENELDLKPIPILLGRPFLRTARTKIDVFKGILTMEFDGNAVRFHIFEAMPTQVKIMRSSPLMQ